MLVMPRAVSKWTLLGTHELAFRLYSATPAQVLRQKRELWLSNLFLNVLYKYICL